MEKQILEITNPPINTIITRQDIAKWYGISERGLRKRFKKVDLCVENRVLTLSDVKKIFSCIGTPPFLPNELLIQFSTV